MTNIKACRITPPFERYLLKSFQTRPARLASPSSANWVKTGAADAPLQARATLNCVV
jgi:hypothetical protein